MTNVVSFYQMTISVAKNGQDVLVGCLESGDLTVSRDMVDSSCQATVDWAGQTPGIKKWSAELNGIYREFDATEAASNVGFDDIFDLLDAGTRVKVTYATSTVGSTRYAGYAYISQVKLSRPAKDNCTWSASFTGDGPLTRN